MTDAAHDFLSPAPPLGEMLESAGHISSADLTKALSFQEQFGGRLGAILIRIGAVAEQDVLIALSEQLGFVIIDRATLPQDPAVYADCLSGTSITPMWWVDASALLWRNAGDGTPNCISRDPLEPSLQETVSGAFSDEPVTWWLTSSRDLDFMLDLVKQHIIGDTIDIGDDVALLRELAEEAPVVELVSNTLAQAVNEGASDIHVEPREKDFDIRYRVDGVLQTRLTLPRNRFDAVASRIKLISGIDIAERRLPQDGRIGMRISGKDLDVRVSSLPGVWGESIVMRLLLKEQKDFSLDRIGMAQDHFEVFSTLVKEPYGIVLVTGPTGSGKSTTLKATLEHIIDGKKKIITVEDPVEYNIHGVTQVQTKSEIDYTFARALRSILRQDPDTIMIGEIRDLETAEIAVQASLTGHMVFSTLHTNDSLSAFTRLIDMGVEPFLVASSVRAVMAQRLARRVCTECKTVSTPPKPIVAKYNSIQSRFSNLVTASPEWVTSVGCDACQHTGYRGRMGLYEMAAVTDGIADLVMQNRPVHELHKSAEQDGFRTLLEDGLIKAAMGLTSVEEVIRVAGQVGMDDK
ncbi:MAG: ATPase, T2SS/T4P/T4SS family [Rhodospirillaceae bacterium]|nr:ATPase, T2SS/T4P/T4SS family [Rhodospirillaceae bacterium]